MTVEERLKKLERELNRAKRCSRLLVVGFGLAIVGALMPWTTTAQGQVPKEIRAKAFVLVDDNGRVRGELNIDPVGGPSLSLDDENGHRRAGLTLLQDTPTLVLGDENGHAGAILSLSKNGPGLTLGDKNQTRASLSLTKNGPSLVLSDEKGKDRAVLGTDQTETPDGRKLIYPESSLLLFGPDGKVLWRAPQ